MDNNNNKNPEGLCRDMKDVSTVFNENLNSMVGMLDSGNIKGCFFISSQLTMLSYLSEYREGVMISELLEGVFSQIGPVLDGYAFEATEKSRILNEIKVPFKEIIENYQKGDKNKLYSAMKDLRFRATDLQIQCWKQSIKKIPDEEE
jgi:hypothetical protein